MHKHGLTWLIVFVIVVAMFLRLPPMAAKQDSVLNTYRALVEVDALAKEYFVEPIQDDRLVHGAIRGMLFQLDPYSGYLDPDELASFERSSAGDYTGVGVAIGLREGQPTVITPIEGSPATKAGILPGDVIVSVDGREVKGLSVFRINELLTGKPGTDVRLTVRHAGQEEPDELIIRRGRVTLKTVHGFRRAPDGTWDFLIDPDRRIGYVRVSNFHDNTMDDFLAALRRLADQGVRGIVLDLRFNPGGLLDQAVAMVDRFVEDGVIVSTVSRRQVIREYRARGGHATAEVKLAVLINGASASAAEIVAGALQDHHRAVIVGERSFGKGSVQLLIYLTSQKAGIMLTTSYYRLPSGRILHRTANSEHSDSWGVRPDVEIQLSKDEFNAIQDSRRALDLARAETADSAASPEEEPGTGCPTSREIVRDRQLTTALALLGEQTVNSSIAAP